MSIAKACRLAGLPRRNYYYQPQPRPSPPPDPVIRAGVVELCRERPSFGYRRITAMLRRRLGRVVNSKRVRRIMELENLTLKSGAQPPRKRIEKHPGKIITAAPNTAWQLDAKYVMCGQDRWVILQSIVDTCTGEWLGYVFDKKSRAQEALQLLTQVVLDRFPKTGHAGGVKLRVDNGPAYRSDRFYDGARALGLDVEYIQVHTPEDNGMIESFHASLDRDYLNLVEFQNKDEGAQHIAWAYDDYNNIKPKQRLGWKTPAEFFKEKTLNANQIA